jgi:hypothetical protein
MYSKSQVTASLLLSRGRPPPSLIHHLHLRDIASR